MCNIKLVSHPTRKQKKLFEDQFTFSPCLKSKLPFLQLSVIFFCVGSWRQVLLRHSDTTVCLLRLRASTKSTFFPFTRCRRIRNGLIRTNMQGSTTLGWQYTNHFVGLQLPRLTQTKNIVNYNHASNCSLTHKTNSAMGSSVTRKSSGRQPLVVLSVRWGCGQEWRRILGEWLHNLIKLVNMKLKYWLNFLGIINLWKCMKKDLKIFCWLKKMYIEGTFKVLFFNNL